MTGNQTFSKIMQSCKEFLKIRRMSAKVGNDVKALYFICEKKREKK